MLARRYGLKRIGQQKLDVIIAAARQNHRYHGILGIVPTPNGIPTEPRGYCRRAILRAATIIELVRERIEQEFRHSTSPRHTRPLQW